MISLALVTALAVAAPQPGASAELRKNYSACLVKFQKSSLAEKVEPAAFSTSLKAACPAEAAAFKKVLVDMDLSSGIKRAQAESNAALDLETYTSNVEEGYKDQFKPAAQPQ